MHSVLHTTSTHTHSLSSPHTCTPLSPSLSISLYLSLSTILLPSMVHTTTTAPADSSTTSSRPQWTPLTGSPSTYASLLLSHRCPPSLVLVLSSSLLPPTPTLLLSTTTSPHSTVSYFFRLIVTCPIALVDSAKVGYSTLQSKAQTAGASTPQTLQGGLEEWLNCCLLKLAFSGWRQEPTTGQISGGVQTLGGSELTGNAPFKGNQPAQITGTEAEPQQIVAQRLLSCLQYPVP